MKILFLSIELIKETLENRDNMYSHFRVMLC